MSKFEGVLVSDHWLQSQFTQVQLRSLKSKSLKDKPNGRFVVGCDDGEYIIYSALASRNRSFGSALEIVWSSDGEYAVRDGTTKIKIFNKSFQTKKRLKSIGRILWL